MPLWVVAMAEEEVTMAVVMAEVEAEVEFHYCGASEFGGTL